MNTIKFCLKCGHPVGPEEKFCMGCGASIADMEAHQGAGNVAGGQQPQAQAQAPQQAAPQAPQQPQGGTFQQPNSGFQQPQQPAFQQAQQFTQPQFAADSGFGTPGAAVKPAGDNWFKKHLKLIIIIACALVVGIAAFFIIKHIFFRFQKIDAKDLYKIEFKGIETSGVATAKLNKYPDSTYALSGAADTLSDYGLGDYDYDDDDDDDENAEDAVSPYFEINKKRLMDAWTKAGDEEEAAKMRDALLSDNAGLTITINDGEKATGLSNGDKIKCVVTCNDSYLEEKNIKIENKEFEVEVEGLKNGTKIDLFEKISVTFTGNDGAGRAEYDRSAAPAFVRCTFKDSYRDLKNGDKVTLVAYMRGATAVDPADPEGAVTLEYDGNYYVCDKARVEKEYTVEGLTEMTKVDIFKDIKPVYRYAVPYLRVYGVDTDACSEEVKNGVRFYVDDASKELKIGDTFKIKAYTRSSFTDNGYAVDGTPDEDGYYYKEFTVGQDAPVYLTKDNASANAGKYKEQFEATIKEITEKGLDRTYVQGFSAGGKITGMSFKESKTYLMENAEASSYSTKVYIAKTYKVSVTTDNEPKTAYGIILLRNPVVTGDTVAVDEGYSANLYSSQESLDRYLESLNRNYSQVEIKATAEKKDDSSKADESKADDSKAEDSKAEEAA